MRVRLALPLLALLLVAAAPLAATPIGRGSLPVWQARFDQKTREIAGHPPRLVFYGDSIMQFLEHGEAAQFDYQPVWRHYYAGRDAVDLGFSGDPTSALIWRLLHGEADGIAPKLAILLIGANNFGRLHWSAADTVTGIVVTIDLIHRKLPRTHVLLLGVLPSGRSPWVDHSTAITNRALAARFDAGEDPRVTYVDASRLLEHDGVVDRSLYIDPLHVPSEAPLHPSPEGWRRIAQTIEPVVARFLDDAPRPPMAPLNVYGR